MARTILNAKWIPPSLVAGRIEQAAELKARYGGGADTSSSAQLAALGPAGPGVIGALKRSYNPGSFRAQGPAGSSQPPTVPMPRPGQPRQYATQPAALHPSDQYGRGPYGQAAHETPGRNAQNPDLTPNLSKPNRLWSNREAVLEMPNPDEFLQNSDPTPYLSRRNQRKLNRQAALEIFPQKPEQEGPPARQQPLPTGWQQTSPPAWQQARPPAPQQTERYGSRRPAAVSPDAHPDALRMNLAQSGPPLVPTRKPVSPGTLRMSFEPSGAPLAPTTAPLRPSPAQSAAALRTPKPKIGTGPRVDEIEDSFEFKRQVAAMQQQLNGMYKQKTGFSKYLGPLFRDDHRDHNARISNCLTVLRDHMGGNKNFIIYTADGKPGALMSLSVPEEGGVKIHGLMSLPGTKGLGLKAVRQAVLISQHEGRRGRVDLRYLPMSNSYEFYRNLGFIDNGEYDANGRYTNHMYLSPAAAKDLIEGRRPRARTN